MAFSVRWLLAWLKHLPTETRGTVPREVLRISGSVTITIYFRAVITSVHGSNPATLLPAGCCPPTAERLHVHRCTSAAMSVPDRR